MYGVVEADAERDAVSSSGGEAGRRGCLRVGKAGGRPGRDWPVRTYDGDHDVVPRYDQYFGEVDHRTSDRRWDRLFHDLR